MRLKETSLIVAVVAAFAGCTETETPVSSSAPSSSLEIVRDWASGDASVATVTSESSIAPVGDMISGLEHRLASEPDDISGWSLLAQSYAYTAQMDRAAEAVEKAVQLGADREELEARVRTAHGQMR